MPISSIRVRALRIALAMAIAAGAAAAVSTRALAQSGPRATSPQKLDDDYTARIKKATPDPRITTELVDHMPASATVPSPLKFLGYVPGEPGHLTYHADIVRYYEALEKASPRVKLFTIGKSEEGRDMVALTPRGDQGRSLRARRQHALCRHGPGAGPRQGALPANLLCPGPSGKRNQGS